MDRMRLWHWMLLPLGAMLLAAGYLGAMGEMGPTLAKYQEERRAAALARGETPPPVFDSQALIDKTLAAYGIIAPGKYYKITRVVDGDTFEVMGKKVRLLGVNTPEKANPVQWYGKQATKFTTDLALGKMVRFESEPGETLTAGGFGRTLVYAFLEDGTDLNAQIIGQGAGYSNRKYPCSRMKEFDQLEAEAKKAGRGLWDEEARAAWEYKQNIPEIPYDKADVVASNSRMLHVPECGIAPDPKNSTPFLTLEQANEYGFNKLHGCVAKRGPDVSAAEATLVGERNGKNLLHQKSCPDAPTNGAGVYFADEAQAQLYGYDEVHGCLKQ
ncbi:MAG: thermonuclease family protein [Planctomycetota bacterium]|jgi:endonuclease YncB( thermonuclease family)